jgi:hypothetical protein
MVNGSFGKFAVFRKLTMKIVNVFRAKSFMGVILKVAENQKEYLVFLIEPRGTE